MSDKRHGKAVSAEACFDFTDKLIVPISEIYLKFSAIFYLFFVCLFREIGNVVIFPGLSPA